MPFDPGPQTSSSGILTSPTNPENRYIPSSVRPDGSTRREIKIRPGYKPPEDVELYKNRTAEAWKKRGSSGVPGAAGLVQEEDKGGNATAEKNKKRREARKRAKESSTLSAEVDLGKADDSVTTKDSQARAVSIQASAKLSEGPEVDSEAEREKKAKGLRKKLRQAKELRERKKQGENLLPEQFEKVIKIQELMRQLEALGFDTEGEKFNNEG